MDLLKDPSKRGLVALAVTILVVLAILSPLVFARDARHLTAFGRGEEDLGALRVELASLGTIHAILGTTHHLDEVDAATTLFVSIGVERRWDPGESEAVLAFLERGGTVLLADERGFGTDVARAAGFAFGADPLLDTKSHRGDPKLPVAEARLDGVDHRVVFNAPTALVPLSNANPYVVLVRSSSAAYPDGSYLDKDHDGAIGIQDEPGPFPLAVKTNVGAGTLLLVADTGLFMDGSMELPEYDNAAFVRALVRTYAPGAAAVVLDEARHAPPFGLAVLEAPLRTLGRLTASPVAAPLLVAILVAGALLAWRLTRPTEDWTHHAHDVGHLVPAPESLRPDLARAQRMAQRRISEKYNIPMDQVPTMSTEALLSLTGDAVLSQAASGALRSDPIPVFRALARDRHPTPPEATE